MIDVVSQCIQAIEVAGVFDHQGSCNFELALARNSWRVRANKLFGGPQKPLIQQIQRHLKEVLLLVMQCLQDYAICICYGSLQLEVF